MKTVLRNRSFAGPVGSVLGAVGVSCFCVLGCAGDISGVGPEDGAPSVAEPAAPGLDSPSSPPPSAAELPWPPSTDGEGSQLRRLSRNELIASLEVLTGRAPARDELPPDTRSGHGPLLSAGTAFIGPEIGKLRLVLDAFAKDVAGEVLQQSGCQDRACLVEWAMTFATTAFRRPVRDTERDLFTELLNGADSATGTDEELVAAVLRSIFFAPSFLYRSELGTPSSQAPELSDLTPEAIASRLSYLATGGPPDALLLTAAANGTLATSDGRLSEYRRLSATERGKQAMAEFVLEWLGAAESKIGSKPPRYTDGLSEGFGEALKMSALQAVSGVLAGPTPTVQELLTTTSYTNDPAVAEISQTSNDGTTGDAPETRRGGMLMHPYVLAAYTKEDGVSPFQIGLALRDVMLCQEVPSAPDGAADETEPVPAGLSVREELVQSTSAGAACAGCHALFAPLGYAFLAFDPVGRWVKQDPTGVEWDLTGSVPTSGGEMLSYESAADLVAKFSEHPQVRGCFTQAALQWTLGRKLNALDHSFVARLNGVAQGSNGDVKQVFEAIVSAPEFALVQASGTQ